MNHLRGFTPWITRRQAPPEVWHTAVFLRINAVLTAVWADAFTATAAILAATAAAGLGSAVSIPVQAAGFVLPAVFTARHPDRVRARLSGATA